MTSASRRPARPLARRDSEIAQLAVIHDTLGSPSADDLRKIAFLPHTSMMLLSKSKKGVPLRSLVPNASDDALDLIRRMLVTDERRVAAVSGAQCR